MNEQLTKIETALTPKELREKLTSMTITDLTRLHNSPHASYYGEIDSYAFDIMNVQYGPVSSVPAIQGEILEGINKTIVNVKMDINSHYKLTRSICYSVLCPIGLIVMLLSALILGGTEYQLHGFVFSSLVIASSFLTVVLAKSSLTSTKRREIRNFASRINGKIIPA